MPPSFKTFIASDLQPFVFWFSGARGLNGPERRIKRFFGLLKKFALDPHAHLSGTGRHAAMRAGVAPAGPASCPGPGRPAS